ncbi:MAG TPA: tRNA 2-thiouridine(34) synthase MnmA, partial [Nitrospiria bacterium]
LGIEHHVMDVQADFRRDVIDDFIGGYLKGETPNPCVRCNERIKFGRLLEIARGLGADALATGHYVRMGGDESCRPFLRRARDVRKDQSYFLYRLAPEILPRLIFPLGDLEKSEVRRRVEALDLPAEDLRESQEICFVTQGDYREFLSIEAPAAARPGKFLTARGEVVGEHRGVAFYTVGQRRGLGLSSADRLYVLEIRPEDETVIVGEESELYSTDLVVKDLNLFARTTLEGPTEAEVKIRYRSEAVPARLEPLGTEALHVTLTIPQRAVTPGQSAVFYRGDELIGGGIIQRVLPRPPSHASGKDPAAGQKRLDFEKSVC